MALCAEHWIHGEHRTGRRAQGSNHGIRSLVKRHAGQCSQSRVSSEAGSGFHGQLPQDGIGYIHVSMGRIGDTSTVALNQTGGSTTTPSPSIAPTTSMTSITGRPAAASPSPATTGVQEDRTGAVEQPAPGGSVSIPHVVGLGGRMGGPTLGFGASARAAVGNRFGIQLEVSRYSVTRAVALQPLGFLEFAPSLIYSLPDRVTDYLWVRPYSRGRVGVSLHSRRCAGSWCFVDGQQTGPAGVRRRRDEPCHLATIHAERRLRPSLGDGIV